MGTSIKSYIDRFRHDRHQRLVLGSVLLVLAIMVTLVVYWQLRYTGITMTNETYCGYEEHTHTDECYELTLICALEESEGHTHTDECYEEQQVLVCTLEESDGHTHDESCYDEEGNLTCTIEESEGHAHTDECYETQLVLICELEEYEGHTHTDECYEKTLICGMEEHTHTVECMVDLNADVEDATVWEATLPVLTEDLRTDVVNIAYSQVGYTESTANYTLAEDGTTHNGYTRYGAWYGSAYADWESMFVAFCLDYAGIADEFTYNAGAYAWSIELTNLGYYQTVESYSPLQGDVVFIDTDSDGKADISAIVISVDETSSTITVIQGNYAVTDSEGTTTDTVSLITYSTATTNELTSLSANATAEITPTILGYANISPETVSEEETASEEIEEVVEEETDPDEEVTVEEEPSEADSEPTEELTEEELIEETSTVEEIVETGEVTSTEIAASEEETGTEEGTTLLTSTSTDYVTQVTELYTLAMSLTSADTSTAATIWDSLMQIWEQIYAEEESGTLTLTAEEYDNVNALTDEVYYYFVETVGYDPYGVATLEETNSSELSDNCTSVTWSYTSVEYEDGTLDIDFLVSFTGLTVQNIISNGYSLVITLPEGVTIPDSVVYSDASSGTYATYYGTDGNGNTGVFTFRFVSDGTGGYSIELDFNETYIDNLASTTTIDGTITFNGLYGVDTDDNTSTINIEVSTGQTIEIPVGEIVREENETWTQDINVTKTSSSYNSTNNTVTYTVVVYSELGTSEITLNDILSITNNSSYSNTDLGITSVVVTGVTYYEYYSKWGYTYGQGTNITNYSSDYDDTTGLTVTLPALSGDSIENDDYIGDCYVITYTVTFNPESAELNSSILNTATAESTDNTGTVTDVATATVTATSHNVTKKGSYNSSTDTITWTITFNSANANIAGYTLTDKYLSSATSLAINGVTIDSQTTYDDFDVEYDSDGNIVSITFLGDTNGENYTTYTIVYVTSTTASLGTSSSTETNEVTIVDENENPVGDTETGVWVSGSGGKLAKEYTEASDISDNSGEYTRDIKWTTTVTIPSGGIASGTELYDYISTYWGETNTYSSTDSTHQWFKYEQISTFFEYLKDNGIVVTDSSGNTVGIVTYYVDGNSGSTNFDLYAYSTTSGWVAYSDLSNHSGEVFTAYKISFNNDVDLSGTWTLSYDTTVDITDVVDSNDTSVTSRSYYNTAKVVSPNGNLSAAALYTEYRRLYKTDGSNYQGTTYVSLGDDGTLTWKVYSYIDAGSNYTYTVTDTLPAGVTLESVHIAFSNTYDYADLTWGSGTGDVDSNMHYNSTVTVKGSAEKNASDQTVVTIEVTPDMYAWIQSSGGYVILTYTVSIDNFDSSDPSNFDSDPNVTTYGTTTTTVYDIGTYENNVTVTWGTNSASDDQTQEVTYTVVEVTGGTQTTEHDAVMKNGTYNGAGNVTYRVVLNYDEKELNQGNSLTFTDELLTYYDTSNSSWGSHATLGSVTFYQLYLLETDTEGCYYYVDSEGNTVYYTSNGNKVSYVDANSANVYAYTETDTNGTSTTVYYYMSEIDIPWTYSEYDKWTGAEAHLITATVPDETRILVEYVYTITMEYDYTSGTYVSESIGVENTATLVGESTDTDSEKQTDSYGDNKVSGTIDTGGGITIKKVDENNYSTTVENAKFAFYKYNSSSGEWEQVTADDYNYYLDSSNSNVITEITDTDYKNPMDDDNYLTTDGSGQINISKNYIYDGTSQGAYSWFKSYTLYYLVEVKAGDGYAISEAEKIYFYWSDDDNPTGSVTYPSDWDYSTTEYDLNKQSRSVYVENAPITTFTLNKVSSSDNTTTISGATFALYVYKETDSEGKDIWVKIGTYTTDKNGQISITYDEELYSFNRAYKLTEVTTADGYNIAWEDETEFYFWWSSDDNYTYAPNVPDGWGESSSTKYSVVYDISHESTTVKATNTETSTTIEVTKVWIDENGRVEENSAYTATVQLYYYLMDDTGKILDLSSATSATELITLTTTTGVAADTTVTLASAYSTLFSYDGADVSTMGVQNGYYKLKITKDSIISAIFNDEYTDSYIQVSINNSNSPGSLELFVEGTYYADGSTTPSYILLTSSKVSPSNVVTNGNTSVVYFSVSELRSLLEDNYYVQDYMTRSGYTAEEAVYALWNSIDLWTNSSTDTNMSLNSFEVVASAAVEKSGTTSSGDIYYTSDDNNNMYITANYSSWKTYFWTDAGSSSTAKTALQQTGALIRITYTDASSTGSVSVGLQTSSGNYGVSETVSSTSGTIVVDVSELSSQSGFSWDNFNAIYIQGIPDGFAGTITAVEVLVPASSSTTTKTYTYSIVDSSSESGTNTLSSGWQMYLSRSDYSYVASEYAKLIEAIETDGAMIYISYTCSEKPTKATMGIQYAIEAEGYPVKNTYNITPLISEGSGYIAVPVSSLTTSGYSLDDYNAIALYTNDTGSITINSVSILLPYSLTSSVSGTVVSTDFTVTLYDPVLGGASGNGTVSIENTGTSTWNAISSGESEPEYDYSNVDDTEKENNYFTGYGFLDAIYANLASEVQITVTDVNDTEASLLSKLQLIIQGDKSANINNADGYDAIATVSPSSVTGSNGTYVLTYQVSDILNQLKSYSSNYTTAAAVFADYNALIMAISGSDSFSATVTDLKVVSGTINTASDTYTLSSLVGYEYGAPYTDSTHSSGYVFTLNSSNDWTVAVANLPLTMTISGTTYDIYYYFVETSYVGGSVAYTTTYSQREGENGGGEIVITNVATTYVLPSTGVMVDYQKLYEFGVMLILLALFGAGAYRNISHIRNILVREPRAEKAPHGCRRDQRPRDVRFRKFVIPRTIRKGDTRAGPDDAG